MNGFSVREFSRADWPWLQTWFEDEVLDEQLGPLDREWLDFVLSDSSGVELIVERDGEPVASVGCAWGGDEPDHTITALAVHPRMRRTGVGAGALEAAIGWSGHPPQRGWRAYVDAGNAAALGFFRSVGWHELGVEEQMHVFRRPDARVPPHLDRAALSG